MYRALGFLEIKYVDSYANAFLTKLLRKTLGSWDWGWGGFAINVGVRWGVRWHRKLRKRHPLRPSFIQEYLYKYVSVSALSIHPPCHQIFWRTFSITFRASLSDSKETCIYFFRSLYYSSLQHVQASFNAKTILSRHLLHSMPPNISTTAIEARALWKHMLGETILQQLRRP